MFSWSAGVQVAVVAAVLVGLALAGRGIRASADGAYRRHVAGWARERGWGFRVGADDLPWRYRLPHGANQGVRFRVDGVTGDRRFTLAHVSHKWGEDVVGPAQSPVAKRVDLTVVVLHLRNDYPAVEVEERRGGAGGYGVVGHPRFDELFAVYTDVPGGPAAAVPAAVAEAQVRGEVPEWALRGRELVCRETGGAPARIRNAKVAQAVGSLPGHTLEEQVARAVRIADLLGVR
ncbi:hypothetical protein ACQPZF_13065 [Actinosynnema sp. CS-041913]|uniref:hypothetical protein n=1 Tax=Actinosynnema sp. CS-041913 TaxID=3239917 RepID=UPI003D8C1BA9